MYVRVSVNGYVSVSVFATVPVSAFLCAYTYARLPRLRRSACPGLGERYRGLRGLGLGSELGRVRVRDSERVSVRVSERVSK